MLAVTLSLPVNSVKQLLALATSADIVHGPCKGGTPAMTDVMAGQVEILFNAPICAMTHIHSGKLKALSVDGLKRTPVLTALPALVQKLNTLLRDPKQRSVSKPRLPMW